MLGNKRGKKRNDYIPDYVIFDLETTGISVVSDSIIEISGIKVKNGCMTEEFTSLVNPQRPIPLSATQVNGITDAMVKKAPVCREALGRFLDFAGDVPLVGHNIHSFDMKFLYRDAERFFGRIPENDYVDTLAIARQYLPGMAHYRLVDLAAYYHISSAGAHRALNDCRMNQMVFEALGREMQKAGTDKGKKCPRCGMLLKKRSGRYGEFLGCSGFPDCRYTERI